MATVWIPSLLRSLTGGEGTITVPGATVGQVIDNLEAQYPGVKARLCNGERLRPSLAIIVDGRAATERLRQPVSETSEIHFVPALSGG